LRRYLEREAEVLSDLRARRRRADPRRLLEARAAEVAGLRDRARRSLRHRVDRASDDVGSHVARARALSPLATLNRGYAVLQTDDGRVLNSVAGVSAGQALTARLADGRVHATTTSVEHLPTPAADNGIA
jgi:exodeoxyribonuclease VII large subunit